MLLKISKKNLLIHGISIILLVFLFVLSLYLKGKENREELCVNTSSQDCNVAENSELSNCGEELVKRDILTSEKNRFVFKDNKISILSFNEENEPCEYVIVRDLDSTAIDVENTTIRAYLPETEQLIVENMRTEDMYYYTMAFYNIVDNSFWKPNLGQHEWENNYYHGENATYIYYNPRMSFGCTPEEMIECEALYNDLSELRTKSDLQILNSNGKQKEIDLNRGNNAEEIAFDQIEGRDVILFTDYDYPFTVNERYFLDDLFED